MNIAIITGASSGMGKEFAFQLDKGFANIDEFWLIARDQSKLERVQKKLLHKAMIFPCDITLESSLDNIEKELKEKHAQICILVNCAGYGILGPFLEEEKNEELGMIRLNCEALTSVTYRFIPYMRKNSRIIQLASSAAFVPQPNFTVYAASKSYVLSFSRALNEELKPQKITVTAVCPGPVDTPFFERADKSQNTMALKRMLMADPKEVVKLALHDSYYKKAVSIYGTPMKLFQIMTKAVPHGIILKAVKLFSK